MHIHLRFYKRFQGVHEPLDICPGAVHYNILDKIKRRVTKWISGPIVLLLKAVGLLTYYSALLQGMS